jgi:hypothetical protein
LLRCASRVLVVGAPLETRVASAVNTPATKAGRSLPWQRCPKFDERNVAPRPTCPGPASRTIAMEFRLRR